MKLESQLIVAIQTLDGTLSYQDACDTLFAIFEDGYMSSSEQRYLDAIATRKPNKKISGVKVDAKATELVKGIIGEKILSNNQFQRFIASRKAAKKPEIKQSQIMRNGYKDLRVNLTQTTLLEKGAFILVIDVTGFNKSLQKFVIELPNSEGRYRDGTIAGNEDKLTIPLYLSLVSQALSHAIEPITKIKKQNYIPVFEAMDRMARSPTGTQASINTRFNEPIDKLARERAKNAYSINGWAKFKGPSLKEEEKRFLENKLKAYPDYVVSAFKETFEEVIIYDPTDIYPSLIDNGAVQEAMLDGHSWVERREGKTKIYLDRTHLDSIGHELFHCLVKPPPAFSLGTEVLYQDNKRRVRYYPEEGFTTSYQSLSKKEYEADGLDLFYRDIMLEPWKSGSRLEMEKEDPIFFLMLTQLDALLKYTYENKGKAVPPFYTALTETALVRAEQYLEHIRASGKILLDTYELNKFREETLWLNVDTEEIFWKGYRFFAEKEKNNGVSKQQFNDAIAKLADSSPHRFKPAHELKYRLSIKSGDAVTTVERAAFQRGEIKKEVEYVSKILTDGTFTVQIAGEPILFPPYSFDSRNLKTGAIKEYKLFPPSRLKELDRSTSP